MTDQTSVQGAVIDLTKQKGMLDDVDEHKWLEIGDLKLVKEDESDIDSRSRVWLND